MRLVLQLCGAILPLKVLVSGLYQVEVEIAIVVRFLPMPQRTEREAKLLSYAGYPVGHGGDVWVGHPLHLDASAQIVGIEARQSVG